MVGLSEILFSILMITPFIINNVSIIYKAQKLRASPLYILAAALVLDTIIVLFSVIGFFLIDMQISNLCYSISLFMTPIILLFLVYFFETYERNSYFSLRTTLYSVGVTLIFGTMLYVPALELIPNEIPPNPSNPGIWIPLWEPWFIISNFTISLIFGIQAALIIIRAYRIMPKLAHKLLLHMLAAIILYSLSSSCLFIIIRTLFFLNGITFEVMQIFIQFNQIIRAVLHLYFAISYGYLTNHPGWLQISKIHKLLVMTNNGITIFSHSFISSNDSKLTLKEIDDQLVGGGFEALRKFFAEVIGYDVGVVQEIKLANFSVLFEAYEDKFMTALLVDSATIFEIRMLKAFTESFYKTYGELLINWDGDLDIFKNTIILVQRYFKDIYY